MGGNVTNVVKKDTFSETVQIENKVLELNFSETYVLNISQFDFSNVINVPCPKISANFFSDDRKSIKITCLCDSGASFSAISSDVFDICQLQIQMKKAVRQRGDPSQADSSRLQCDGETVTNFSLCAINGEVLKLLNVRMTIIRNLSHKVILGMDVLGKLKFQIHNQTSVSLSGKLFRTDRHISVLSSHRINFGEKEMTVNQLSLSHRPFTNPDTDVTLYRIVDGSGCSFNYFCCVNFSEAELESDVKINMFHDSVKTPINSDETGIIAFNFGKVVWSGQCTLNALNNPIKKDGRKLIQENFYLNLLKKSAFEMENKTKLKEILCKYRHVFSRDETDIGLYVDEEIDVKLKDENVHPPYLRARPIPYAAKEFVRDKVKELTKNGIFEEVKKGSAYNSPCHIVMTKKEDGSTKFRLCVDYSQLNKYLIPDCYPIPRIRDIINDLDGAKYFTSIDLRSGFWNLKLKKKCRDLLSFSVGQKQLRPVRLPMGLCTSPSIFQRVMRTIMAPFLNKFVHIYIDDCIIYSKTSSEHLEHINLVLKAFEKSGILLNAEKCAFGVKELKYLGFMISDKGWQILPKRKKEIEEFKAPRNQKEVKRFIGVVGFLTPCCEKLQFLLDPLHKISGSKSKFKWTEVENEAFENIKRVILNSVMMAYPKEDPSLTLFLSTDSSEIGWGGVLSQVNEKGIECPLGFCSGAWKNAASRWDIRNKEFHALVNSLDYFYEFLFARNFVWRCDNQALAFLKNSLTGESLKKNQRILRALDFVNEFNFSFELRKGTEKEMELPDYLSRRVEPKINCISELSKINLNNFWARNECTLDEFITMQKSDPCLTSIKSFNKSKRWKFLKDRGLKMYFDKESGLAMANHKGKSKILVPEFYEETMIKFWHLPIHRSPNEISKKLEDYLFPKMNDKISRFVKRCEICCSLKPDKTFDASMTKTSTPKHPWSNIMIDLLGPYPQTERGNKFIMVTICQLTGFTVLKVLKNKSAIEIVNNFDKIFNQYGLPLSCSSDNGKEFKNDLLKTFLEKVKVSQNFSTPYRPRTQGQVERTNKEILKYQKSLMSSDSDWDKDINLIAFLVNNSYNRNIGLTPFEAFHGWKPIVPSLGTFPKSSNSDLRNIDFNLATRVMKQRLVINELFAQRELIKAESQKPEEKPFLEGTYVLYKSERPLGASKLFNPWLGQFKVIKRLDNDSYLISPKDDPRKTYIAYRGRLRPLGHVPKVVETDKTQLDNKSTKSERVESKDLELEGTKYGLRKRSDVDYRKFY